MNRLELEQKRKRKPGGGRKKSDNKIKMIPIYIRSQQLEEFGGEINFRNKVNDYFGLVK